jgi:Zn-dependent M16 (insulinase) family peptidase
MELTAANELDVVDVYAKKLSANSKKEVAEAIEDAQKSLKKLKSRMKAVTTFKNVTYSMYLSKNSIDYLEISFSVKVDTTDAKAIEKFRKVCKGCVGFYHSDYDDEDKLVKKTKTGYIFEVSAEAPHK